MQHNKDLPMSSAIPLRLGEKVMPKAPVVQLSNGDYCVPQHYLTYHHTLQSVETLICDIEYDPRYVVFASQDDASLYIQVGVVGHDNYHKTPQSSELKLLFGRKWRVEPELSTSEIIQTVFLAIKKSREHEIRELFKLRFNNNVTTPFNTHIDLPLMAEFYDKPAQGKSEESAVTAQQRVKRIFNCINYDNSQLTLKELVQRNNGLWLVDIELQATPSSSLSADEQQMLYLQVADLSLNTLTRALMQALIEVSDVHVDQHFSYRGFHRFDPEIDITVIADLSQQTRKHELAAHFSSEFSQRNYEVDQMRIPTLKPGVLAQKYKEIIEKFHLPS